MATGLNLHEDCVSDKYAANGSRNQRITELSKHQECTGHKDPVND